MTQNKTLQTPVSAPGTTHPLDIAILLDRVNQLLASGQANLALTAVEEASVRATWVENARAVCLLRLGRTPAAIEILRKLVFDQSGFAVRADAEPLYQANYATALFLDGNTDGFLNILDGIPDRTHPAVARLDAAVRAWRAQRTWGEWTRSLIGIAGRPLTLDFPPGEL